MANACLLWKDHNPRESSLRCNGVEVADVWRYARSTEWFARVKEQKSLGPFKTRMAAARVIERKFKIDVT